MKKKTMLKYRPIYFFIIILSSIGIITGRQYYKNLTPEIKTSIKTEINFQKSLENRANNLPKRAKQATKIFIYSILILPAFLNVFEIYMSSFSLGIMFSVIASYKLKFKVIYLLFYNKHLALILKKYLLLSIILFIYEFLILIYSPTLNNYLLSLI